MHLATDTILTHPAHSGQDQRIAKQYSPRRSPTDVAVECPPGPRRRHRSGATRAICKRVLFRASFYLSRHRQTGFGFASEEWEGKKRPSRVMPLIMSTAPILRFSVYENGNVWSAASLFCSYINIISVEGWIDLFALTDHPSEGVFQ